ncbi:MAG: hypothetical protein HND47_09740 [Chloroflexi bacterium]|nr:hypothetical protein [Chloroflexota bacterium]
MLDAPPIYQYKNGMKKLRLFLGLWLALSITACSALENFPNIPPGWTVTPSLSPTPRSDVHPHHHADATANGARRRGRYRLLPRRL